MYKATTDLVSPNGVPVTLEVGHDDDHQTIVEMLQRAEKIGVHFSGKGWTFARQEAVGPCAVELAPGPHLRRLSMQPHGGRARAAHLDHRRQQAGATSREAR